mmetsp:Transcript_13298/g.31712  ORF Transcript_13298/g.31712 Transcript_13298/m.31712 type:complete len:381 (-) Transcript_13298:478-1620(-)
MVPLQLVHSLGPALHEGVRVSEYGNEHVEQHKRDDADPRRHIQWRGAGRGVLERLVLDALRQRPQQVPEGHVPGAELKHPGAIQPVAGKGEGECDEHKNGHERYDVSHCVREYVPDEQHALVELQELEELDKRKHHIHRSHVGSEREDLCERVQVLELVHRLFLERHTVRAKSADVPQPVSHDDDKESKVGEFDPVPERLCVPPSLRPHLHALTPEVVQEGEEEDELKEGPEAVNRRRVRVQTGAEDLNGRYEEPPRSDVDLEAGDGAHVIGGIVRVHFDCDAASILVDPSLGDQGLQYLQRPRGVDRQVNVVARLLVLLAVVVPSLEVIEVGAPTSEISGGAVRVLVACDSCGRAVVSPAWSRQLMVIFLSLAAVAFHP